MSISPAKVCPAKSTGLRFARTFISGIAAFFSPQPAPPAPRPEAGAPAASGRTGGCTGKFMRVLSGGSFGMPRRLHAVPRILGCCVLAALGGVAIAADANPRTVNARDPKLDKEFEYLVYDLGKGVELKLVKVSAKGKSFMIGSSPEEQAEVSKKYYNGGRPSHSDETQTKITFTDDFYIGQLEINRAQFRCFVEETGYTTEAEPAEGGYGWNEELQKFEGRLKKYNWQNTGAPGAGELHPVTNVTRTDARKFCAWLSKKGDGKVRLREVRLPGEAEWEFACRAGSTSRFSFGDDDEKLVEYANVQDGTWRDKFPKANTINGKDGHVFAAPGGQLKPNAFGIYDMHGNVWEWVEDVISPYSALPKERNQIQTTPGDERGLLRGGAWGFGPREARSAYRYVVGAGASRYGAAGFRIVCMP